MSLDVMLSDEIKKEVERQCKTAGSGDFDRVTFERSLYTVESFNGDAVYFALAKFIAPVTGAYRISYDYTNDIPGVGPNTYYTADIWLQRQQGLLVPKDGGYIKTDLDPKTYYYNISLGYSSITIINGGLTVALGGKNVITSVFKNVTEYVYLLKGTPLLMWITYKGLSNGKTATFTMKNLKITY